jgi:predicted acylesterase/phospholipase RssA
MAHFNIIVLEGGGAKGPYEMGVLYNLENMAGVPIKNFIKLVVSTSVGTVIGSLICTGKKPISYWSEIFLDNLPKMFTKRGWPFPIPKYDTKNYLDYYYKHVGPFLMKDLPIWLMCTSVDMCEPKTHFFKSWEEETGNFYVPDITIRSFSAPLYFGATIDKKDQKVWLDGGMGYNNLPLMQAYIEALRQGWLNQGNSVHILAIGSGHPDDSIPFEKAKKHGIIRQTIEQIMKYVDVNDGGMTREMSTKEQINNLKAIIKVTPNLTFQWINWDNMPKKFDKIDDVKARYIYYNKGLDDGTNLDIDKFKVK